MSQVIQIEVACALLIKYRLMTQWWKERSDRNNQSILEYGWFAKSVILFQKVVS